MDSDLYYSLFIRTAREYYIFFRSILYHVLRIIVSHIIVSLYVILLSHVFLYHCIMYSEFLIKSVFCWHGLKGLIFMNVESNTLCMNSFWNKA